MFQFVDKKLPKPWRNHEDEAKSMLQATECLLCGDAGHVGQSRSVVMMGNAKRSNR